MAALGTAQRLQLRLVDTEGTVNHSSASFSDASFANSPSSQSEVDPVMTEFGAKDYVDSKLESASARTDAEFTKVLAELKIINATMTTRRTTWSAVLTGTGVVAGLLGAFLTYGGDRFDGGVQLTASSIQYAIDAQQQAKENADQIKALAESIKKRDEQIDAMFELLKKQNPPSP